MDPFIQVRLGEQLVKTETKKNAGQEAQFTKELALVITEKNKTMNIEFEFMDDELIKKDEFIGEILISAKDLISVKKTTSKSASLPDKQGGAPLLELKF
mmetsp:Transcript_5384/g.8326  ORF Transcript_5384/g.8326 Transcript_5384/m.8326 type:complete len:99 (+) Transcript_5384:846-1142(+)